MASFVRGKVSKRKRRFVDKKNGFDLDLSYITPNIIAMGFPSENMEAAYRNPATEVLRFLDHFHKDHYKIYNLCSERSYDAAKFHGRVEVFPFDDHNAPPFEMIEHFCRNVEEWLQQSSENIAVIHCKAGKGRTGLMICAVLLHTKEWSNADQAMSFYAAMRTYNQKGVTIPSQIRYIRYYGLFVNGTRPHARTLQASKILFHNPPKHFQDIKFNVFIAKSCVFSHSKKQASGKQQRVPSKRSKSMDLKRDQVTPGGAEKKQQLQFKLDAIDRGDSPTTEEDTNEDECVFEDGLISLPLHGLTCQGDVKFEFFCKNISGSSLMMYFWFNTGFVEGRNLSLTKDELDKINKDKNNKVFPHNFRVELVFDAGSAPGGGDDAGNSRAKSFDVSSTAGSRIVQPRRPDSDSTLQDAAGSASAAAAANATPAPKPIPSHLVFSDVLEAFPSLKNF